MATPNEINPNDYIKELAQTLKGIPDVKAPIWARFVKTGLFKERPPINNDWWHIRAAAVLRTVYRLGPVGTSKLRTKYGGKKNRGVAAEHSYKGSGSIIRKILQQLEKAGLITQGSKGVHKGRIITPKGQSLLNSVAKTATPSEMPSRVELQIEKEEQTESTPAEAPPKKPKKERKVQPKKSAEETK